MSKSVLRSIRSGITHSGPSYNATPNSHASLEKSTLVNALTHSGPSYEIGLIRKISAEESAKIATDEVNPLIASLRPLLAKIKGAALRLDRNGQEDNCAHLEEMQSLLGKMVEVIELDYLEMSGRMRRGFSPFAVTSHYAIWKQRRQMLDIARQAREAHELASEALAALQSVGVGTAVASAGASNLLPDFAPTVVTIFDRLDMASKVMTV